MNLELAIVQSCDEQGCLVRLVGREAIVETRYSQAVRNRIRIRRGDLVAVDGATQTPQLVWRWRRGEVLQPLNREPAPGYVLLGAQGCAFEARLSKLDAVAGSRRSATAFFEPHPVPPPIMTRL